ncbi:unnamed protein product [Rhizopus stolonifer]
MLNYSNRNNADSLFDLEDNNLVSREEVTEYYFNFAGFVREDNTTGVGLGDLNENFDRDFDEESNADMHEALALVANMVTENNAKINSQISRPGVNMDVGDPDYLDPFTAMKTAVEHCKTFAREYCFEVVREISSNKGKTVYITSARGKKINSKRCVAVSGTDEKDKWSKRIRYEFKWRI